MTDDYWTCHVCGELRPDAQISVAKAHKTLEGRAQMGVNLRYCNDDPLCSSRAQDKADDLLARISGP